MNAKIYGLACLVAGAFCVVAVPAEATPLVDHGITYTLTESIVDSNTHQFVLGIAGINGSADDEGGRFGVGSFAFNPPAGFSSATAPTGFTFHAGGLNSSGCNGHGNFFCFSANNVPTGPALAANSSLSFLFQVDATSFTSYSPDFKINWVGTKNNYDLVSKPITSTSTSLTKVPEPVPLALFGFGLLGLGYVSRRKLAS